MLPDGGIIPALNGMPIVAVELVGPLPGPGAPSSRTWPSSLLRHQRPWAASSEDSGDEGRHLAVHARRRVRPRRRRSRRGTLRLISPPEAKPVVLGMQGQRVGHLCLQPLKYARTSPPCVSKPRAQSTKRNPWAPAPPRRRSGPPRTRANTAMSGTTHAVGPAVLGMTRMSLSKAACTLRTALWFLMISALRIDRGGKLRP